jgi:multiple sugar transport system ATP-binding protein
MAGIRLERVVKRYGATEAVRELSLEIRDGELLTLVGPSGCGKSTLLQLIAGLERPSEGRVFIGDRDVTALEPVDRDVAMVFQSYALYPHLDVAQNLAFPLKVAKLPRAEIDRRVTEVAHQLELDTLLRRKPRELSGGQRQRVALGRALVRRPKVFLFDEPLSNLDPALRGQMRAELKRLHEELRATFVYVTHDQLEAMTLSDRVAVLSQGSLQQLASPEELYAKPSNLFVARFIGEPRMNVLSAKTLGLTGEAQLGLRAEHVEVGTGPVPPGALPASVELVEPLGGAGGGWLSAGGRLVARAAGDFRARAKEPAWFRPDLTRALRFDPKSGQRLD